jgi:hypothetical protein
LYFLCSNACDEEEYEMRVDPDVIRGILEEVERAPRPEALPASTSRSSPATFGIKFRPPSRHEPQAVRGDFALGTRAF